MLLDIGLGLHANVSFLAASLREAGVRFIFSSGSKPPFGFENVPLVCKPYAIPEIITAMIMAGVVAPDDAPRRGSFERDLRCPLEQQ